jgi:hypothetical protein
VKYIVKLTPLGVRLIEGPLRRREDLGILPEDVDIRRFVAEFQDVSPVVEPQNQLYALVFQSQQVEATPAIAANSWAVIKVPGSLTHPALLLTYCIYCKISVLIFKL